MPKLFCYCGAGPDIPCPCEEEARRYLPQDATTNAVTPETIFGEGFNRPDLDASRRIWQQRAAHEEEKRRQLIAHIEYERSRTEFDVHPAELDGVTNQRTTGTQCTPLKPSRPPLRS